jgi:hypothetical protein
MAGNTAVPKFTGLVQSAAAAKAGSAVENPALNAIRSAFMQVPSIK